MAVLGSQRCRISTLWLGPHLAALNGCLEYGLEQTHTRTHPVVHIHPHAGGKISSVKPTKRSSFSKSDTHLDVSLFSWPVFVYMIAPSIFFKCAIVQIRMSGLLKSSPQLKDNLNDVFFL